MTSAVENEPQINPLLAPIREDEPTGTNLRYEQIYDDIREAQREDDPNLPQGEWETELKRADWRRVAELCETALCDYAKDLRVAAWLVEARIKQAGPAAAAEAVALIGALCDTYWAEVFPHDEDEDFEARVDVFEWLNRRLHLAVRHHPLFDLDDVRTLSLGDWEKVVVARLADDGDKNKTFEIDPADFDKALKAVPTQSLMNLRQGFDALAAAVNALETQLDQLMGRAAPSFKSLREILTLILRRLDEPLAKRNDVPNEEVESDEPTGPTGDVSVRGAIQNRDQAYQLITKIADFLEATEPHSPTPYLLRRVAEWGGKSLMELMEETITSQDERSRYMTHFFLPSPARAPQNDEW